MNHKKLILVGFISAFVAILTSILGVAGTVIGSVISSVLYNMLSEALEKPVSEASFKGNFEWDIAYVFPLVVIAIIQLLLIFALLSEVGLMPNTFLNVYLSLQDFANNNLYRLLGLALLVISAYPFILKPDHVKKEHGVILIFVGLIFLARGFVDLSNPITNLYDAVFAHFDLPIAIIAFILIVIVIVRVLSSARQADNESKSVGSQRTNTVRKINPNINSEKDIYVDHSRDAPRRQRPQQARRQPQHENVRFKREVVRREEKNPNQQKGINKSAGGIQFESNDLLDDYKK